MKGYRTCVVMALGLLYSVAAGIGFVIPEDEQAAISTGIVSIIGLVLRFMTDTKVGEEI